jgi:hypothetical protein
VDGAGNTESVRTVSFTIAGTAPDTTKPVTTSNAAASYTATAVVTLSATDSGSGVAATYYRVDGGAQASGAVVTVGRPATGSASHTLQFWSVDKAGNVELAKSVAFTVTRATGTGTLRLVWGDNDTTGYEPSAGSYASWRVRGGGASGPIVTSGSADGGDGWTGVDDVVVPVSTTPYYVYIDWYDSDWDSEGPTVHFPVNLTSPGAVVTLHY